MPDELDHTLAIRPDWILLGYRLPDGSVNVYGSIEMDTAELRVQHRFDARQFRNFHTIVAPQRPEFTVRVTATMKRYAVANAPTYAAALQLLFREWSADEQKGGRPNPLGEPQRQIGPS